MTVMPFIFIFCPLIGKLYMFEYLIWTQGSKLRKQRISDFIRKKKLYFIFSHVKYNYYLYFHM